MQAAGEQTDPGRGSGPVLIAGATGRTGRLIAERLAQRQVPVHALVRDPAKGQALPDGVRPFVGNILQPDTLAEAMAGARVLIVTAAGTADPANSAELVDYFGTQNLVEQASAAGIELVIYVSSIYITRPEHYQDVEPGSLGWKARGEEVVRRSGLDYCIVRAGWLTDEDGGHPLVLTTGDVAEGHLSRSDLADVCVQVLELAEARGKTFEVVDSHGGEPGDLAAALAGLPADGS